MVENVVAGLLLTGLGGFTAWAARRAVAPDVDPQRSPGLRTLTTMADREVWLAAHRPIAPAMWWLGVLVTVAGNAIIVWVLAGSPTKEQIDATVLMVALVYLAVSAVLIVIGLRAARQAADR